MANSSYTVNATEPISIYPAGQQDAVTILNNGANTVYLSEVASAANAWPLGAGNSMQWNAHTPLYASVSSSAAPTTLLVSDNGNLLPVSNVGINGPIATVNSSELLYNSFLARNTLATLTGLSKYSTLVIKITPSNVDGYLFGNGAFIYTWQDATGNTIVRDSVTYDQGNANYFTLIIHVKSDALSFGWQSAYYNFTSITVTGLTATLPESYVMPADVGIATPIRYGTAVTYGPGTLATGTALIWKPPMIAGDAMLSLSFDGTSNSSLGVFLRYLVDALGNGATATVWRTRIFSSDIYSLVNYPIIIARNTGEIQLTNYAAPISNIYLGLSMKGAT